MCGPKGTSFLFVKKEHQKWMKPVIYSWGKNGDDPEKSEFLQDFQWQGTRDMSAFLTVPKIIEFFNNDLEDYQDHSRQLIKNSQKQFQNILQTDPISIGDMFLGQMVSYPLPNKINKDLKRILWEDYKIEIPIFEWKNMKFIRLSIYAYNDQKDIDSLMNALRSII
jgi:isopenicillin-N epimerase